MPTSSAIQSSRVPASSYASAGPSLGRGSQPDYDGPIKTTGAYSVNSELPTPPVPAKSDEVLQKAIQERLSDDDMAAFQSAPDIIERLQEMQGNGKSLISRLLTTRVENVLQCVKSFMGSLAVFVQQHPELSSLVVGGVNCVLTLVLGYIEFFERLTEMMECIGTHLSYLSEYSRPMFQESKKLQEALLAAYCDLLEFYVKARQVFINKKGKPSHFQGFKLFFRLTWEPFEAQFDAIEARFSNHTLTVVRLANIDYQNRALEYRRLEEDRREKEEKYRTRRKILKWLSSDDFNETHDRHFEKRSRNTGQWLLSDPRFRKWRDETKSCLLWCYGAPGSGKTVLASLVIEHLSTLYQLSADTALIFIYCNYEEPQTTIKYIRLALKQLCQAMQSLPLELQEVYERHYWNDRQPKYDELRIAFLAVTRQFHSIFFVIDALDEFMDLDQRKGLCEFVLGMVNNDTATEHSQGVVKILITSRKDSTIEQAFHQTPIQTIEVESGKVDRDIKVYVKAQIELRLQNHSLRLKNMALKNKILRVLTTKASGMFLWAKLQLDAICAEISDSGIEEALKRIPNDMSATYKRIFSIINAKPRAQCELARKVLIWTAYAQRPLSIDDLAHAFSIQTGTKDWESSIPSEESIIDACANLVLVDQSRNRYVRFIHFSVQEFLTSHSNTLRTEYEAGHREIAQICMNLLTLFPKQRDFLARYTSGKWLYRYIFDEWPRHLLVGNLNNLPERDEIVTLALSFLEKIPMLLTKQPIRLEEKEKEKTYLRFSPPVLALIFNLPGIRGCRGIQKHLQGTQPRAVYDHDLNCMVLSNDKLAIHYAIAELDSVPVARRLYNHGYTLNYSHPDEGSRVPDWLQLSALYSVQSNQMARYLLDKGISIEPQGLRNMFVDPLKYFAQKGNRGVEVFQLLLKRVVKQDGRRLEEALLTAVQVGCVEAVQILLDRGVDFNNVLVPLFGTVLQAAVHGSKLEVIRLLLDQGAHVNVQGGMYGNALQAAVFMGRVEVTQLLLDNGASVNTHSVLQAGVYVGQAEVIRLLLDKGADVNAQGGRYGNALQTAVWVGRVEIIRLLLDRGANINAQGGMYGNALRAAACSSNIQVIRLLLDKGANINAQGRTYGNALQAAARVGKVEVIQLLLDKGADANAHGGMYGSALQAAAYGGKIGVIRLLLDKGANINALGGIYGNALGAAAHNGNVQATRLLLDNGASVNIQGGMFGTVLQAAAYSGKKEVIQLLLDSGGDVNIHGGMFGTVLQAAAYSGNTEAVQLLLDRGADVHTRGGKYGVALWKMLQLQPVDAGQKMPAEIPLLVELLQDHAPFLIEHIPESGYILVARRFLNEDRCSLDVFRGLLEGTGRLETERDNKMRTRLESG